jgi:hypothetical protein
MLTHIIAIIHGIHCTLVETVTPMQDEGKPESEM